MPFPEVASHNVSVALTEHLFTDHSDETFFCSVLSVCRKSPTDGKRALSHSTRSCFCKGMGNHGTHQVDTFPYASCQDDFLHILHTDLHLMS